MKLKITGRPISKKNNRRNFGYTSLPSVAFEKFHASAISQLLYRYKIIKGKVCVNYVFYMKGKLDSDTDNMIGGINDILQDAGIIENDKYIIEGSFKKIADCSDWLTEIEIISTT